MNSSLSQGYSFAPKAVDLFPVQFLGNVHENRLHADPADENAIAITLKLRQVPLGVALMHVVDLAKLQALVGL